MLVLYLTDPDLFGVPSTFQACTIWSSFWIGNPSLCTVSFEMKHSIAPLSINAFAPTISASCFQIKMGRQMELVLDPEMNTGAIVKEKDGIGPSSPLKRYMMIRERNMGHSFYSQDSGGFIPFFSSGLFISKGISLFI